MKVNTYWKLKQCSERDLSARSDDMSINVTLSFFPACKRKDLEMPRTENTGPKKPRLVFTDIQRRTLYAIFKETKRPSKEMQATIAEQLGLKVSTVANFFMNARRRSIDKYTDDAVTMDPQHDHEMMSPPPQ